VRRASLEDSATVGADRSDGLSWIAVTRHQLATMWLVRGRLPAQLIGLGGWVQITVLKLAMNRDDAGEQGKINDAVYY